MSQGQHISYVVAMPLATIPVVTAPLCVGWPLLRGYHALGYHPRSYRALMRWANVVEYPSSSDLKKMRLVHGWHVPRVALSPTLIAYIVILFNIIRLYTEKRCAKVHPVP